MNEQTQMEQELHAALTDGEMCRLDADVSAVERLIPRYEIRIPAKTDPIVEETLLFRSLAREPDDRYDKFVPRA